MNVCAFSLQNKTKPLGPFGERRGLGLTEESAERRTMGIGAVTASYRPDYRGYGANGKAKDDDFYSRLSEAAQSSAAGEPEETPKEAAESAEASFGDYWQMIRDHIAQMTEKIESGDIEESFQIGSQSFTLKEWDELLARLDAVLEEIRKAVAEEVEKKKEAAGIGDARHDMLVSSTVQARFPSQEYDDAGERLDDIYLIAMDRDGIRCSKAGSSEYEWMIVFEDESQYERAAEFMEWASGLMDNFLFAAHSNFWEDYLNESMDVDAFKEFLSGTDNGIPNYGIGDGNLMRIDRDKIGWAKYMNPLGIKLYTGEEFLAMINRQIEENLARYKVGKH